jgi:hypothetical protein
VKGDGSIHRFVKLFLNVEQLDILPAIAGG